MQDGKEPFLQALRRAMPDHEDAIHPVNVAIPSFAHIRNSKDGMMLRDTPCPVDVAPPPTILIQECPSIREHTYATRVLPAKLGFAVETLQENSALRFGLESYRSFSRLLQHGLCRYQLQ